MKIHPERLLFLLAGTEFVKENPACAEPLAAERFAIHGSFGTSPILGASKVEVEVALCRLDKMLTFLID